MRANHPTITMLIAGLVVLASLGPAVAAGSVADANADLPAQYSAHDDHANVSVDESLRVHMHIDQDDWTIDATHEGEGTATVTIEALEGSYEGEGTYEIDGEETIVLPVPDEPAALRVTVESEHVVRTQVLEFVRVPFECADEEVAFIQPVLVRAEVTVDGEQVYAYGDAEARAHPDLPEVDCDAEPPIEDPTIEMPPVEEPPIERPNVNWSIEEPPSANWSVEDSREAYNWSHEQARESYENSRDEARDAYEESRDEAREAYENATRDAWESYHEAYDFARQVSGDARDDAEMVREDAEEDGERVANDTREDATTVAEDANDAAEQVKSDAEDLADDGDEGDDGNGEGDASAESETRANASASADASASYDDGSASADASANADASVHSRTTVDSSHTPGLTADVSAVGQLKAQLGGQASA